MVEYEADLFILLRPSDVGVLVDGSKRPLHPYGNVAAGRLGLGRGRVRIRDGKDDGGSRRFVDHGEGMFRRARRQGRGQILHDAR